jgi:hypothetical protein
MMVSTYSVTRVPLFNDVYYKKKVVTLLIVNSDNLGAAAYDAVFKSAGLDTLSYAPTAAIVPSTQWPTLGALIDSGKRLLTFLDNGADFTTVPYLIDGVSILH